MGFLSRVTLLLEGYEPADERERAFRRRMLDLAQVPRAVERSHFVPGHFTTSAFVLSPQGDEVLLIFHRKLDRWLQPGGHVDETDDDPLRTARREVLEEVGVDGMIASEGGGVFDIDVHGIPARKAEPAHEHFDLRFLFQARSRDFVAGSEVGGARWVSIPDVPRFTDDESVMRAVRKVRRS